MMKCNVVRDLIPLYIDECCSAESADIVREHIESCDDCRAVYESMRAPAAVSDERAPSNIGRVEHWLASLLQSALLFLSFAVIVAGVAMEASTPYGSGNAVWAFSVIIPATGFMLSLANWFFIRLYRNRRQFKWCSLLMTLLFILAAYTFGGIHYEMGVFEFIKAIELYNLSFDLNVKLFIGVYGVGILFSVALLVVSLLASDKYAKLLGKE